MVGYVVGVTCEGIRARWVVSHRDRNSGMEGVADGTIAKSGDEGYSGSGSGMTFAYSTCWLVVVEKRWMPAGPIMFCGVAGSCWLSKGAG